MGYTISLDKANIIINAGILRSGHNLENPINLADKKFGGVTTENQISSVESLRKTNYKKSDIASFIMLTDVEIIEK